MSSYNKIAEDLVRKCWEEHALNGFWKEANFEKHDHGTSFSLFERVELEKAYYYIAHEWIKQYLDPAGLYTKKRSLSYFEPLQKVLSCNPWDETNLKPGQKVWMKPLREISTKYRRGEIGDISMLESNGIVDLVNCVEEHGYQDTHGSCYSWEIVMVRDDDVWHTFEAKQKRSD